MIIKDIISSGAWDYREFIAPFIAFTPVVTEGALLIKNLYLRHDQIASLIQKEIRVSDVYLLALKSLTCFSFMARASFLALTLLPQSIAAGSAIAAIYLIGRTFWNWDRYQKAIIASFTPQTSENILAAKKRILENAIKTVFAVTAAFSALIVGGYIVYPLLTKFSWTISLPFQTKAIVFAEYAALGIWHAKLTLDACRKKEIGSSLFHLTAAALSFAFPIYDWSSSDMRLHHSFYGLFLMALSRRPAQFFGSAVTLDSALYFLSPLRGYSVTEGSRTKFYRYDFINTVVERFSFFMGSYIASLILNDINQNLEKGRDWVYVDQKGDRTGKRLSCAVL